MRIFLTVLGIVGSFIIFLAGIMATSIWSVGGNSIAEAFYHATGWLFIGFSIFTLACTGLLALRQ